MKVVKHGISDWKQTAKAITTIRNDNRVSRMEFTIMDTLLRCNVNKYFPTASNMAKQFGRKPITIKRCWKHLKQLGYIKIIHINTQTDNNNTEIHVYIKPNKK